VVLTVVFCKLRRRWPELRVRRYIPAATGIFLLVLLAAGAALYNHSEFVRSFIFWQSQGDNGHDLSNLGHAADIQRGIMLIQDSPITGMGFGGDLPGVGAAWFDIIHNEFLHFWLLLGIGGAITWIYMFAVLPVQFVRRLDRLRLDGYAIRPEHYLVFSYIACAVAHAIAVPSFHLSVPQIWAISLCLASLTSLPAVQKEALARNTGNVRAGLTPPQGDWITT